MPIFLMVRLRGIEPPHPAPEAGALSTELQAHNALLIIAELDSQVKGQPLQSAAAWHEDQESRAVAVFSGASRSAPVSNEIKRPVRLSPAANR